MRKIYLMDIGLLVLAGTLAAVLADEPLQPAKGSKTDKSGEILEREDRPERMEDGSPFE